MTATNQTIESCTTTAAKKWHLSDDLEVDHRHPELPGRRGRTLCGVPGAIDQDRLNHVKGGNAPDIEDMTVCESCGKALRARGVCEHGVGMLDQCDQCCPPDDSPIGVFLAGGGQLGVNPRVDQLLRLAQDTHDRRKEEQ